MKFKPGPTKQYRSEKKTFCDECFVRVLFLVSGQNYLCLSVAYRLFAVYKTRHFLDFLIYYWE